jgi:hypothetical protein
MCNVLSEQRDSLQLPRYLPFIYLMFSFSSHSTSEETTYPEGTCMNRVQMKIAFVYYTQFTINSTEIREIAQYLTRSHRYTRIWNECRIIIWFVVIEIIKSNVPYQIFPLKSDGRSGGQYMTLGLCNHKVRVNESPQLNHTWVIQIQFASSHAICRRVSYTSSHLAYA